MLQRTRNDRGDRSVVVRVTDLESAAHIRADVGVRKNCEASQSLLMPPFGAP
jgi:hypothetical protein